MYEVQANNKLHSALFHPKALAQLIVHMRAVSNQLLEVLEAAGVYYAWLQAWAELGAHRNQQRVRLRGPPSPGHCSPRARSCKSKMPHPAPIQQQLRRMVAAQLLADHARPRALGLL